jgi:hypothetical protein
MHIHRLLEFPMNKMVSYILFLVLFDLSKQNPHMLDNVLSQNSVLSHSQTFQQHTTQTEVLIREKFSTSVH